MYYIMLYWKPIFISNAMPVSSNELLDLFISLKTHLSVSDMLWRFKDDALQFMRILCTYYYFKSSAAKFIPSNGTSWYTTYSPRVFSCASVDG